MKKEGFIVESDLDTLAEALTLTRRMRATSVIKKQQDPLNDAEQVTKAAANLIVATYGGASQQVERDLLQMLIGENLAKYSDAEVMQQSTHTPEHVLTSMQGEIVVFDQFWNSPDSELQTNRSEGITKNYLTNSKLTVFSPLSRDYLYAQTVASYINMHNNPSFHLEPVAVASDFNNNQVIFRSGIDERNPSYPDGGIGVFLDTIHSFRTGWKVKNSLTEMHPEPEVHVMTMRRTYMHN